MRDRCVVSRMARRRGDSIYICGHYRAAAARCSRQPIDYRRGATRTSEDANNGFFVPSPRRNKGRLCLAGRGRSHKGPLPHQPRRTVAAVRPQKKRAVGGTKLGEHKSRARTHQHAAVVRVDARGEWKKKKWKSMTDIGLKPARVVAAAAADWPSKGDPN